MSDAHHDASAASGRHRTAMGLAAVALVALGGGVGAIAMQAMRPPVAMAPTVPVAIRSLSSDGIVTIKGRVAEIYGNKFIVADTSGRMLVDTGREGEGGDLVTASEPVTVQGRFERGYVHAAFLVGPDAKVVALGPLGGPRHGPPGGPDRDPAGPPPPPPGGPADAATPPPPPPAGAATPAAARTPASTGAG